MEEPASKGEGGRGDEVCGKTRCTLASIKMADVAIGEHGAFEQRLTREILQTERFRVTLLAIIPGLSMLLFLAAGAAYPELTASTFSGELDRFRVGAVLGGVSVYEFVALRSVDRLIKGGARQPMLRRYVDALVEVSLPSVVIAYYMAVVGPIDALFLPPVFTYFVFILLSTLRLDFALSAFTGLCAALEYAAISLFAVTAGSTRGADPVLASIPLHLGKAAILLVSGVAAGFVGRQLRRSFVNTLRSVEDRNRVIGLFGQHVSPAVVDRLLAAKADVGSELREVCVMFVDVRNFTAFSEDKSPEEVVGYLNALFALMIESINAHHGIVNKFLGDGAMAIFGAPLSEGNPCRDAVDAAREILTKVDAEVAAGRLVPTRLGIGLHTGPVVIGNIGSPQRKEYTVIGDVVNVASRVESLNKELGSRLLVTEEVWRAGCEAEKGVERAPADGAGEEGPGADLRAGVREAPGRHPDARDAAGWAGLSWWPQDPSTRARALHDRTRTVERRAGPRARRGLVPQERRAGQRRGPAPPERLLRQGRGRRPGPEPGGGLASQERRARQRRGPVPDGDLLRHGHRGGEDPEQAAHWYHRSAEGGDSDAQFNLAVSYANGEGVARDLEQAAHWYRRSAEQGNAEAQYNLGVSHAEGKGVARDLEQAVVWYHKSAEQGHALAQFNLGGSYGEGHGVAQDFEQAVAWYRKSAEQGNPGAQFHLGASHAEGNGVAQDFAQAVAWYRQSAEQGHALAQFHLGVSHAEGNGVAQDFAQAVAWYRQSAQRGSALAQHNLGTCYARGEGVAQNLEQAVVWYRKSAEQGQVMAQFALGNCYFNGEGVDKDLEQAASWYRKSAEQGNPVAQAQLEACTPAGQGVATDPA